MTLHEKGRAAMKKKDYAEAVLLLLESDKEFVYVKRFYNMFTSSLCGNICRNDIETDFC